jgi:hypothetical protein
MSGYRELLIIGAPRSGTNMLRDAICRLPGFATWPCDEINYIWRHGNARWPSDALPAELATPPVRRFINRQFQRRADASGAVWLVEKTCANSLRVPFVDRVLPGARYLFIHRDAVDAVASAMKRWQAPFELGYTLRKARFVPPSDVPYYAWRLLRNRLHRRLSGERRVATWGPRLESMAALVQSHTLPEVCALQWAACVEQAAGALAALEPARVLQLSYEAFVAAPVQGVETLARFLGADAPQPAIERAAAGISDRSVGKGARDLTPAVRQLVAPLTAAGRAALNRWPPPA